MGRITNDVITALKLVTMGTIDAVRMRVRFSSEKILDNNENFVSG